MLLAIDVGNTNTVLGVFSAGRKLERTWRISTHPAVTDDELRIKIHQLFEISGLRLADVSAVTVSSVVPTMTGTIRHAFSDRKLEIIDAAWPFSFKIKAQPATSVGADRLVNAEAALREYGAPAIVLDSGTATTLCAISRAKEYLGGAIMPGIDLAVDSLARKTAQLFSVELAPPPSAIGGNTAHALQSGILYGYAEMLDGMVERFRRELGEPQARVVATGGVSLRLKGILRTITDFDPDLTLKGIAYLHEAVQKG